MTSKDKYTKTEAQYGPGKPSEHCGICKFYRAGLCTKVAGAIDPEGWCRLWRAAQ
jgi:hypothetical protein